jgi:hypothetical protein
LTGLLAVARYLSTEQLSKLLYAARNVDNMRRRFLRLAGEGPRGFKPAYLRRLFYRTYEGHHLDMWTLTNTGYAVAEIVLGTAIKIPRHDVGAAFREHTIVLNGLFVALMMPTGDSYARAKQDDFRWIPSDTVRLPWRQNLGPGSRTPDRLVLPDAVLEIPSARRRFFLECEMGTHPILSGKHPKPGSTIAKVQSYEGFLRSYADASATQTFYARSYPDKYLPEVLFLVRTPHRTKAINEAIRQWHERYEPCSAPTKTEARRIADELERKAEFQRRGHELIPSDSNLTLSEICEWWLQNRCKPARACNERFRLQQHVLSSTLGAMPVRSVTGELIERQFRKMESAGLSAWTHRLYRSWIRRSC